MSASTFMTLLPMMGATATAPRAFGAFWSTGEVLESAAWVAIPLVVTPLVVFALRPLFAVFLTESQALFTDRCPTRSLDRAVAHYVAVFNTWTFLAAWVIIFFSHRFHIPWGVTCLLATTGLLVALALTVWLLGALAGLRGSRAWLVGLVTFAGGNLPLFLLLALVLALR